MKRDCYRRISGKEKLVMGLELSDLVILQVSLMLLLMGTGSLLLTFPLMLLIYFALRAVKKNKTRYHSERLARFLIRPRYFNLFHLDERKVMES